MLQHSHPGGTRKIEIGFRTVLTKCSESSNRGFFIRIGQLRPFRFAPNYVIPFGESPSQLRHPFSLPDPARMLMLARARWSEVLKPRWEQFGELLGRTQVQTTYRYPTASLVSCSELEPDAVSG